MPFCPSCRFEYVAGVDRCPDCGLSLVESLPPAPPSAEAGFVQVELCTVLGEINARLLQDLLASQGIPSRTDSAWPFAGVFDGINAPRPIGGGFGDRRRVMVNTRDLSRAQVILRDFESRTQTYRQRVLSALAHKEPDQLPVDLGGTESSGLTAVAYNRLKGPLAIDDLPTRVFDPYQQVVLIDDQLRDHFRVATYPLVFQPRHWRRSQLSDGSECEVPRGWRTVRRRDGSEEALDPSGAVIARRAATSYHFDSVNPPLADVTSISDFARHRDTIERFDYPAFADESLDSFFERAHRLRRQSDRAAILNFQAHILAAGQILRGFEAFMTDLVLRPDLADYLLSLLVDAYCQRADTLFPTLNGLVDVILVNDDLGTQAGPMLSPDLYRKRIKPFQRRLFSRLKAVSGLPLLLHSCGSVRWAIPDLIEVGVDALNPVQVSAAGMDTAELKRDFGRDITFWGGGCDTQHVLNRGTPDEVREEVRRRIADLAPGGGFVFCQVHNIQPDVPPDNIIAMLEAAEEFGGAAAGTRGTGS
ncbi:MAG: uroporphyrinogen decarboxylase family protein [Armatimonadota bacterium]